MFARYPLRFALPVLATAALFASPRTVHASDRGSLLILPNIVIKWDAVTGEVIQDAIITLSNDYPLDTRVNMVFINGDPPTDAVTDGAGNVIERSHPGWNRAGCQINLGGLRTKFWSALTGLPGGCPFSVLDSGDPPGRPDPDSPSTRVLRGFIYIWAIDQFGREMRWNFLRSDVTLTNFSHATAWAYTAQAFRALIGENGDTLPTPGELHLDGVEFEAPSNLLTLSFFGSGSTILGPGLIQFQDTELTLLPVSQDFRQDNNGPINTKAKFSISNMFGSTFSGTVRCITCWDQKPVSMYASPNHFKRSALGTDIGSATIDGQFSTVCGLNTQNVPLTGLATKIIAFTHADADQNGVVTTGDFRLMRTCLNSSGPSSEPDGGDCRDLFDMDFDGDIDLRDVGQFPMASEGNRTYSTLLLGGQGTQTAIIRYDVPNGP